MVRRVATKGLKMKSCKISTQLQVNYQKTKRKLHIRHDLLEHKMEENNERIEIPTEVAIGELCGSRTIWKGLSVYSQKNYHQPEVRGLIPCKTPPSSS